MKVVLMCILLAAVAYGLPLKDDISETQRYDSVEDNELDKNILMKIGKKVVRIFRLLNRGGSDDNGKEDNEMGIIKKWIQNLFKLNKGGSDEGYHNGKDLTLDDMMLLESLMKIAKNDRNNEFGFPSYNDDAGEKFGFGNNFETDHDAPLTGEDKEIVGWALKGIGAAIKGVKKLHKKIHG